MCSSAVSERRVRASVERTLTASDIIIRLRRVRAEVESSGRRTMQYVCTLLSCSITLTVNTKYRHYSADGVKRRSPRSALGRAWLNGPPEATAASHEFICMMIRAICRSDPAIPTRPGSTRSGARHCMQVLTVSRLDDIIPGTGRRARRIHELQVEREADIRRDIGTDRTIVPISAGWCHRDTAARRLNRADNGTTPLSVIN